MMLLKFLKEKYRQARYQHAWSLRNDDSLQKYFSERTKNRIAIRNAVLNISPETIYEYGCYSGPNLKELDCTVYGSDINSHGIEFCKKNIPNGNFICSGNIDILKKWLPHKVDLTLFIAVDYTMKRSSVEEIIHFICLRSSHLILGVNTENFYGTDSELIHGSFRHPWEKIIEQVGEIIERFEVPNKDYALSEILVIKSKFWK